MKKKKAKQKLTKMKNIIKLHPSNHFNNRINL